MPGGCIDVEPPPEIENTIRIWDGTKWNYQDTLKEDEEIQPEPLSEEEESHASESDEIT